jgi:propionyl-CoA synthetase
VCADRREEVVASHPAVVECAVIGCQDELKGELPCCLIVLKHGVEASKEQIASEIVSMVCERIGPIAALKRVIAVGRLPKTRSGKILRTTMKRILDGDDYSIPATIDDPAVLAELECALQQGRNHREISSPI